MVLLAATAAGLTAHPRLWGSRSRAAPPPRALAPLRAAAGLDAGALAGCTFNCTGCGDCCRVDGDVWLDPAESATLRAHLGLGEDAFAARYLSHAVRTPDGRWERLKRTAECAFLGEDGMCGVYEARPLQCRTYPFWPRLLRSSDAWRAERAACEGIDAPGAPAVAPAHALGEAASWQRWLDRFPVDEAAALAQTERWAREVVVKLSLCPWAAAVLDRGELRLVATTAADEAGVRDACAAEARLLDATRRVPGAPSTTLVVAPRFAPRDFARFHDFVVWLEEEQFGRALEHDDGAPLGDAVAVAGFHRRWAFGGLDDDAGLHWEKRSPHATVSLIRAADIEGALAQETTAKIGEVNAETLTRVGGPALAKMFRERVLRDATGDEPKP